jgi:hypothetical protein
MVEEGIEAIWYLGVPFAPVVATGLGVELVSEIALAEARGKTAVRFEQGLVFSGGEVDVGSYSGIGGLHKEEGIAGSPRRATVRPKDGPESHALPPSTHCESAAGDIDGRADRAGEEKEVGATQDQIGSSVSAHGYADDGAILASASSGETRFNIGDEVMGEVIFVSLFGLQCGIYVVGGISRGHDQDQPPRGILGNIRAIR